MALSGFIRTLSQYSRIKGTGNGKQNGHLEYIELYDYMRIIMQLVYFYCGTFYDFRVTLCLLLPGTNRITPIHSDC